MKKVVFIISGFAYSGAEIVLDRYIYGNTEIDPYFIIMYDNNKVLSRYINLYGEDKVYSLNLKHNKNILRFLPLIDIVKVSSRVDKILNKINPKILYMNNTHEMMLCKSVVKNTSIKSIAHIHDMRKSIKSPIKRFFMDKSLKYYNEVITVSEATKEDWQYNNMKVIYNGIDEEYFSSKEKSKIEINKIGFIGKISDRKGFDLLYSVYKDNYKLQNKELLIGYADVEDNLSSKLDELKELKNVKTFYKMSYEEIKDFYDSVDLLVVPSKADPLPTVILEAMARGCLVIGSNIDGIPELLGNDELLFNVNDYNSLKCKLFEVMSFDRDRIIDMSIYLKNRCHDKFIHNKKRKLINDIIINLSI